MTFLLFFVVLYAERKTQTRVVPSRLLFVFASILVPALGTPTSSTRVNILSQVHININMVHNNFSGRIVSSYEYTGRLCRLINPEFRKFVKK